MNKNDALGTSPSVSPIPKDNEVAIRIIQALAEIAVMRRHADLRSEGSDKGYVVYELPGK